MFTDHPLLKPFLNLEPDIFTAEAIRQVIAHQQEMPRCCWQYCGILPTTEGYNEQDGNCLHRVALGEIRVKTMDSPNAYLFTAI